MRQLSQQSGHSTAKLYRIIDHWLSMKQPQDEGNLSRYRHLIFDGTFLHRPVSLVAIMDAGSKKVIGGKYGVSENSERQLVSFFQPLIDRGLKPISCTVDGNPQASRVLRKLWPDIITQRCLIHIQRQGLSWCRVSPRTTYARRLRKIFLQVTRIRTPADRDKFLRDVTEWEVKYGTQIRDRRETGYVFSDIKRARSMLLRALPDMFHYLDNPMIPISTNGLEGYFSRMKNHYRQHRGLTKIKLLSYFDWYLFLRPK